MFLLPLLATAMGAAHAQGPGGSVGVAAQVVAPHQRELAREVPLPMPGHVMLDDGRGRHYFFEGGLEDAARFFDAELRRLGYAPRSHRDGAASQKMHWQRGAQTLELELRANQGQSPTRVSVRATGEGVRRSR